MRRTVSTRADALERAAENLAQAQLAVGQSVNRPYQYAVVAFVYLALADRLPTRIGDDDAARRHAER